jgi:hypothetical protein
VVGRAAWVGIWLRGDGRGGLGASAGLSPGAPVVGVDGRESVQQGREECPIAVGEPWTGVTELALQDSGLVPQRQDLRVLVPVAHGQQAQQRERVGHAKVGQSEQHSRSSCRVSRRHCGWQPSL